jgi:SAM-dependent methyltransferase
MSTLQAFYEQYHLKNKPFRKTIGRNNFTYFNVLNFLHANYLDSLPEGAKLKVLDVGCGVGSLSLYLAKLGHQVTGIDLSQRAIKIAQGAAHDLKLKVHFSVGELQNGTGGYDLVICSEVIEHVPDDLSLLKQLRSHLKPTGWLLLTTPSRHSWWCRQGWYAEFDEQVGHLRRYSRTSLRRSLTQAGLAVEVWRESDGILRNILFTTPLEKLIWWIRGPLVPLFHFFDALAVKAWGGDDCQVLAKRQH